MKTMVSSIWKSFKRQWVFKIVTLRVEFSKFSIVRHRTNPPSGSFENFDWVQSQKQVFFTKLQQPTSFFSLKNILIRVLVCVENGDKVINFKEFCQGLSVYNSKAPLEEKLECTLSFQYQFKIKSLTVSFSTITVVCFICEWMIEWMNV